MLTRLIAGAALAALALGGTSGSVGNRAHGKLGMDKDSRHRGPSTHRASAAELAVRDRVARAEAAKIAARKQPSAVSVPADGWVSLGPTDALAEFNGVPIAGVDSGRPNQILVDPRDANTVYMAVSGGGLWKTFDFGSDTPHWNPVSDVLPNLAIGAFAHGSGEPRHDLSSATATSSTRPATRSRSRATAASTWATPVGLAGTAPGGTPLVPLSVRALAVQGNLVLAGTDVGLFTSTDGGATFSLVDLPDAAGTTVPDSVWSIASTGGSALGRDRPDVLRRRDAAADRGRHRGRRRLLRRQQRRDLDVRRRHGVVARGDAADDRHRPHTVAAGPVGADPTKTVLYAMVGSIDGFSTTGVLALRRRRYDVGRRDRHAREPDARRRTSAPTAATSNLGQRSDLVQPGRSSSIRRTPTTCSSAATCAACAP